MKYSDMQKQLDSGRFEKRPRNTTKPAYKRPQRREPALTQTPDSLTAADAQLWLAEQLKQHGCDLYAGDSFEHFSARLRATILANRMQAVLLGRNKAGALENYAQAFERLCGEPLVPRVTPSTTQSTSRVTV